MKRKKKDRFFITEDEINAEALRLITECREKRKKRLDFSKLGLKKIPPEIAELSTLEELDLTGYRLKKVPDFIGNIISLKKLSLGSSFSGAHEREKIILPDRLCNLRNLRRLSLGYDIPEIPSWVWTLENLEELSITNDFIESIPAAISGLKQLRKLQIHGEKLTALPGEIGEQLSLTALDLQCPRLEALPGSFANLKTLEEFFFNRCNLKTIPGYICGWINLIELTLSMACTFQGPYTKLKTIPRDIGKLGKLKRLEFLYTSIAKIPDSLGSCPLEYLELSGDFGNVPESLGNCSELKTLKLFSARPISLPASFGKLLSLRELRLHAPGLEIPASFGRLASLEDLFLETEDLILPKSFENLRALRELLLDSPQMRGIPDSIGNCGNLKLISINSDELTALPESLCKLKKLEELYLDTFALKALPAAFGSLSSLRVFRFFSGALTSLPESMGGLKKLESLSFDAHNAKELPASFKKLSYIKKPHIVIGQKEQELSPNKEKVKKDGTLSFKELSTMSWQYRRKLLGSYSLKQLETLLCSAPRNSNSSEKEKELFRDIMLERYCRLKSTFKWTLENKKRIAKVSGEFLKAWEDGFTRAKLIIEALYEKEKDKKTFQDKYWIEIILHPEILFSEDENNSKERLYDVITGYFNPEIDMNMCIKYDPATKNEDNFREEIHINRDLSWNIEGFGDIDLEGYYICYALHVLYSHNNWAFQDIPRINNILTEIRVSCDSESF